MLCDSEMAKALEAAIEQHTKGLHALVEDVGRSRAVANGLYGMLVLICNRPDVSDELRNVIASNHRVIDAAAYLGAGKIEPTR